MQFLPSSGIFVNALFVFISARELEIVQLCDELSQLEQSTVLEQVDICPLRLIFGPLRPQVHLVEPLFRGRPEYGTNETEALKYACRGDETVKFVLYCSTDASCGTGVLLQSNSDLDHDLLQRRFAAWR
jgi:hypothetical protein